MSKEDESKEDELANCPLCFSSETGVKKAKDIYYIACCTCGLNGPKRGCLITAIKVWNERPPPEELCYSCGVELAAVKLCEKCLPSSEIDSQKEQFLIMEMIGALLGPTALKENHQSLPARRRAVKRIFDKVREL